MIDQKLVADAMQAEREILASVRLALGDDAAAVLAAAGSQARSLAVALTVLQSRGAWQSDEDSERDAELRAGLHSMFADVLTVTISLGTRDMDDDMRAELRPFIAQIVRRSFDFVARAAASHARRDGGAL
jgi:hypothetical protein